MRRCRVLALFCLVLCLSPGSRGWSSERTVAHASRPDVILISIDTLRADHLGCYGYSLPTSPAIDAFRRDAVLFREMIAQAPSTLPSHASLFTSLIPQHHGASSTEGRPLPPEAVTLTEVLRSAGYVTNAVVGGGQLSREFGLDQGFDRYEQVSPDEFAATVNEGLALVDGRQPARPLFLFLHTYQAHHPYTPEKERMARLDRGYEGTLPADISVELLRQINHGEVQIDAADLGHIVHAYDAEIQSADDAFADLVRGLKEKGLYDESLIILVSDHGEEFGEHGYVGWHSHTLHDELLEVPFLVKLPAQRRHGVAVSGQVQGLDLAPTILAAVGLPVPSVFEGKSLLPAIRRGTATDETAVIWRETMPGEEGVKSGIRTRHWKMTDSELFDLLADPGEMHDLIAAKPQMAQRLRRQLRQRLASRKPLGTKQTPLDVETAAQLRALGYAH